MSEFRRRLIAAASQNENGIVLPSGYKKVNYVGGDRTGQTGKIDTGVGVTPDIKIKAISKYIETTSTVCWQGINTSSYKGQCFWGYRAAIGLYATFDVKATGDDYYPTIPYDEDFHEYYLSNGLLSVDDTVFTGNVAINKPTMSIYLFRINNEWNVNDVGTGAIYNKEVIIWKGDEKIRHYVPCIRVSDNKAGMYDIVNNTFNTCDGLTAY